MKKKTNSKNVLLITSVVLGVILALLIAVLVGMQFLPDLTGERETEPTTQTEPPIQAMTVSTPFGDLLYPAKWEQQLRTEYIESDVGGVMIFCGKIGQKEAELFSIRFSSEPDVTEGVIGALVYGGKPVLVSLQFYDPEAGDWKPEELETAAAMAEDCNYLLDQLANRSDFHRDYEALFAPADLQIETPFCTLAFPGKWTDRIWWEFTPSGDGGLLNVYGLVALDDVSLFTLCFGTETDGAFPVGSVKVGGGQVSVALLMAEPEDTADWAEADWDEYSAMQESVNDLMASLSANPDFTPV